MTDNPTPILITTRRTQGHWEDLAMVVLSCQLYGGFQPIHVAWDGPTRPPVSHLHSNITLHHRPRHMSSAEALWWLFDELDLDGPWLGLSDDTLLCPDTLRLLAEDHATITTLVDPGHVPGMIVCRSNYAGGAQNVRCPVGVPMIGILRKPPPDAERARFRMLEPHERWVEVTDPGLHHNATRFPTEDHIGRAAPGEGFAPYAGWFHAGVWRETLTPPPVTEILSDDLLSAALQARGHPLYVSRAYVHHHGARARSEMGLGHGDAQRAAREGKRT